MDIIFDTNGNEKQKDCVRAWVDPEVKEIVYGGAKGGGKSFLGCSLIFGDALMYPGTHYFIARKTLKDLRSFTRPSINEVFKKWKLDIDVYSKFNSMDSYYELHNGSRVYLMDAKYIPSDPDFERFGSMQFTRGWIEEAGEFERACKENLNASIGRKMNNDYNLAPKLLMTCNPSKNFLYDEYRKNKEGKLEPEKRFFQAFPQDNKALGEQYIENLYRSLTGARKERLLFGNWEYDDDPSVMCDYEAICDIFTNSHVLATQDRYISADLAMQGRDKFIAGHWQGLVGHIDIDMGKSSGRVIELSLNQLKNDKHVPNSRIVADADGLGGFLDSYLEGIVPFHGGARSFEPDFFNLKSECAFKLAELINDRKIYIKCNPEQQDRIKQELGMLKRLNIDNDETKKRIISKDQMKESLGFSPDYLDFLLMRMYFEIYNIDITADYH